MQQEVAGGRVAARLEARRIEQPQQRGAQRLVVIDHVDQRFGAHPVPDDGMPVGPAGNST